MEITKMDLYLDYIPKYCLGDIVVFKVDDQFIQGKIEYASLAQEDKMWHYAIRTQDVKNTGSRTIENMFVFDIYQNDILYKVSRDHGILQ